MCVCVCVCMCIYICIYIYKGCSSSPFSMLSKKETGPATALGRLSGGSDCGHLLVTHHPAQRGT